MSLKAAFATVLKAMRISRGLTHKDMALASSRGYMLKLEHGRSSPTVEKLTAIGDAMGLSPLTLLTLTLSVESGQSIDTLVQQLKAEVADLETNGAFSGLVVSSATPICITKPSSARRHKAIDPSSQAELCFAE
ncbi:MULTISPECIES: helix-turn-helix domain-containing protein [Pseudomonas]|uniref:helix-turn-helix domain-containing protein n=1 Tax=Pseudomonas TaxID=286 RepID=UPI0018E6EC9C|nr:helix-turn-helix transcriptional regulator [Pseudomonas sp. MF6767]MBJ2281137.1 helix-turn-helix transcriptional regulator [Pseudomonas sp. MF6767]